MLQKKKNIIEKKISLVLSYLFFVSTIYAQQNDNKIAIKKFVDICGSYTKPPFYVNMQYQKTADIGINPTDTLIQEALFYVSDKEVYAKLGEVEQLANDSVGIVIRNDVKQIRVYKNDSVFTAQLKKMGEMQLPESDIVKMNKKYDVVEKVIDKKTALIQLLSKKKLEGTNFSVDAVDVLYDLETNYPISITSSQLKIIPIAKADYYELKSSNKFSDKILTDNEHYFIMQKTATKFMFTKIIRGGAINVPVHVIDRIEKDSEGNYFTKKGFEEYLVEEN